MELHVGRGVSSGALTVFPVWVGGADERRYSTDVSQLVVEEVEGGPAVPTLSAANPGAVPVLVLEGHLFEGGWQHRMATKSCIVGASRITRVEVACVEQGRWGGTRRQGSRGRRATPFVRSGAHATPAGRDVQGEVWRRVERYRRSDVLNETGTLVGHLDHAREDLGRITRPFRPLPGQAGVVVAIAGQPFLLEVFDDPQTLREQFDSIIEAAALDALGAPPVVTPSRRARRMVERLEQVPLRPVEDLEIGRRLGARTSDLDVAVLDWDGRPVHLRATYLRHPALMGV